MKKLRIGIVNDVRLAQELLKRFIQSVDEFEVAWIAADGREAVNKAKKETPDLILMDLIMPEMDGVAATREIMRSAPCAILIVTSSPTENSSKVFEAMGYGALDVVMTPTIALTHDPKAESDLYKKISTIARLLGKSISSLRAERKIPSDKKEKDASLSPPPLVVIGASTGGPFALSKVLSHFPPTTPCSFVVIQHIDERFAPGFAKWLGDQISLPVRIARTGDSIKKGEVLIAGSDDHLIFSSDLLLKHTPIPREIPYRPSVDLFFESVARYWPTPSVAILLTGMGEDGARGMKALFDAGWYTIAEHQNSCVVYGMPKAAIDLGAVKHVALLEKIASEAEAAALK